MTTPGIIDGEAINDKDRIPPRQKLAFVVGQGADVYGHLAVADRLWLPFFNIGLGLSPVTAGSMLMFFRLVEAFGSPIVGTLSDNTRTRWGRRRPWIFAGAFVSAVSFPVMLLASPDWGQTAIVLYTLVLGTIFFAAYTVWSVPFFALGMEMTPDYDERTRLGAWMAFAAKLFSIPAGWILLFVSSAWFVDQATGKPDLVAGVQAYGLIAAPVLLALGVLPALFVTERYYEAGVAQQPREGLWRSFKESASCRPLWPLTIASVFLIMGFSASRSVGTYVNIYYIFGGNIASATAVEGLKFTITFGLGILILPLLTRLSERYDKRNVIVALISLAALGNLLNLVCLTPERPYLQLVPAVFSAGLASSVWMFLPAMKADVVDHDELITGRRREGSLNAFYSWFFKLSLVLSAGLDGVLLTVTGFRVGLPAQSPDVLNRMVLAFSLVPTLVWAACVAAFLLYRLDRARLSLIRVELECRRGTVT